MLNSGNGNDLTVKLDAAISSLNAGNTTAGVNQLQAFIHQVMVFYKVGKLSDTEAQSLVDAGINAIASAVH